MLKFLKDEIELNFGHGKQLLLQLKLDGAETKQKDPHLALEQCQKVFLNAASKAASIEFSGDENHQNSGPNSFNDSHVLSAGRRTSLDLVTGDNINFYQALQILMEMFRVQMISKRFNDASELIKNYINPFLIKNLEKIHCLDDSDEGLDTKSLIREKEQNSKLLDSIAKSDDFTSAEKLKSCQTSSIMNSKVFGITQDLHFSRVHKNSLDTLMEVFFLDPSHWIFDFFDIVGPDNKRRTQLAQLREILIKFILRRIVTVIENCPDKKLQYDEM